MKTSGPPRRADSRRDFGSPAAGLHETLTNPYYDRNVMGERRDDLDPTGGHTGFAAALSADADALARDGDNAVLKTLYRKHWRELCAYAARTFGAGPPDPEDLAQTAFFQFAALDAPEKVKQPRAYLYRSVHNAGIAYHRREETKIKYAGTVDLIVAPDKTDDVTGERVLLVRERLRLVEAAVAAMPDKKRTVLLLARYEGLSKAEIAHRLKVSETQVKRLLEQAVLECRRAVSDADASEP